MRCAPWLIVLRLCPTTQLWGRLWGRRSKSGGFIGVSAVFSHFLLFECLWLGIAITLPRRNGTGAVSFVSGWMVYPDGKIILTTPYGGKGHENA